jgi:hypothetical protein
MIKSSNKIQIALDSTTNLVYNTMTTKAHDVRVIKHIDGSYNTFANFPTVQEAVAYMRNWNPAGYAADSWYIINADGIRLRMNPQGKLQVFNSLIG